MINVSFFDMTTPIGKSTLDTAYVNYHMEIPLQCIFALEANWYRKSSIYEGKALNNGWV